MGPDVEPLLLITRQCLRACLDAGALNQFNEEDMRKLGTVCSNVAENLKKVPWNSAFTSYDYLNSGGLWHRTQKSQYVFDTTTLDTLMHIWNNMQTICDDLKTYTVKVG